jgi:integrase
MRGQVAAGFDPRPPKVKASAFRAATTFDQAAEAYIAQQENRDAWKNKVHAAQWRSTIASLPEAFRDKRVDDIGVVDVFEAISPIWDRTPETGARLRGRIATVLDSVRGPDELRANPAAWEGWLKRRLGNYRSLGKLDRKTGERKPRGNHPTMPYDEVPAFLKQLKTQKGVAALALEFTILTAARTTEAIEAPWSEINLDAKVWTIPATRMKMDVEHRVPLSERAVEILREREANRQGSEYVFASPPLGRARILDEGPLSNMAMAAVLKRMKVAVTVHGFRASFRNWATDVALVQDAIAERCLAHIVGDKARKAYDTSDRFSLRRPLMQQWADYCAGETGQVVPFKRVS